MEFSSFHPELSGRERLERFYQLPAEVQRRYWSDLRQHVDRERAAKLERSRSQREPLPGNVDVRLRMVQAADYVRAITGREVQPGRRICCPLPDHDDDSRDFGVKATKWRCFGCNRGGTIYDLSSLVWRIPASGQGFKELQERLYGMRLA